MKKIKKFGFTVPINRTNGWIEYSNTWNQVIRPWLIENINGECMIDDTGFTLSDTQHKITPMSFIRFSLVEDAIFFKLRFCEMVGEVIECDLPLVYLAGPEVFPEDSFEIGSKKKHLCSDYGFEGLFPCDDADRQSHSISRSKC